MQFLQKYTSLILTMLLLVFVSSCQDSITETIEEDEVAKIEPNSNISNLLGKMALKDGSNDNIIDKANNITVVLPITVIVNGIEINVSSENDFQLIENAIEAFNTDNDVVNITFPIDIILSDYAQVTVFNEVGFDSFISQSTDENELDEDIECIDFEYPISFEALEINGTIPSTIVVTNDEELFELIDNLENFATINLNFPVTLITADNVEIIATDLNLLESNIDNNIDTCDEDDDFDFDDDDENVLFDFLTNGNWIIDEYATVDDDFTEDYNGFIFTFNSNTDVNANNGTTNVSGSWAIDNTDPNNLLVVLDFSAVMPFGVLNESWNITESEVDRLALRIGSEMAGDLKILVFEKL